MLIVEDNGVGMKNQTQEKKQVLVGWSLNSFVCSLVKTAFELLLWEEQNCNSFAQINPQCLKRSLCLILNKEPVHTWQHIDL